LVIIDFHTHIFSPKLIANRERYAAKDRCFSTLYSNPKARLATANDLIAEMDSSGVDKSVILNIGWTSHDLCAETNDYLLESAAKYPNRLISFIMVQPLAGDRALREIERCAESGAKGVGELRPDVQGIDLSDRKVIGPFVEAMIEWGLILLSHADEPVGHPHPGKGAVTPAVLYPFIEAYPELKLVLAHWGGGLPFYTLMPEVKATLKNTWFDSAASPYLYSPAIYQKVTELSGVDKILCGSDWPLLGQTRCLREVKSQNLPFADKILGGNAAALLGIADG
jgi:predicted TIM-barrel fold metal-dependent hydrolase